MEKHIVFNKSANGLFCEIKDNEILISFKSGYNINVDEGDYYILMQKNPMGAHCFTFYGKIISAQKKIIKEIITQDEKRKSIYQNKFILSIQGILEQNNYLEDFAYSLGNIINFSQPYIHFAQKFRHIREIEFDIIVNGRIFIERTAFGIIFNSLCEEHKENFLVYLVENNPKLLFSHHDYQALWEVLYAYIKNNIENPVDMLLESYDILKEIVNIEDMKNIYMYIPDYERSFKLEQQVNIVKENGETKLNLINSLIQEYKSNEIFENDYFYNLPLPIKL